MTGAVAGFYFILDELTLLASPNLLEKMYLHEVVGFVYGADRMPAGVAEALVAFVAAACFATKIAAFLAAWRRKLVSVRTALICLTGYLLLLAYLYLAFPLWGPLGFAHMST